MKQTEELFANGKVTSDGGRGRILANGTAFVEGTAFEGVTGGGSFYNSSPTKTKKKTTTTNNTKNSVTGETYKKTNNTKDTTNDFEESFDWIETKITRIETAIDRLDKKANSTWRSWTSRNNALTEEIEEVGDAYTAQQRAYNKYMDAANGVGLSNEWKKRVQSGTYDISTVKDETLANKIKSYEEWYNKAQDCKTAMLELKDTEAELVKQQFDNIATKYDAQLERLDNQKAVTEENITQSKYTTTDGTSNTKNYKNLISLEEKSINKLKTQKKELETALNKAVEDGTIKKYSEEWYTMQGTIDDVALRIEQSTTTILEAYESMFDGIAEKYDATINRREGEKDIYASKNEKAQYTTKVSKRDNKNYQGIIDQDKIIYEAAKDKRDAQQKVLDDAIADGLKVGSEKWNNLQAEINAATLEMSQAQVNILQTYEEMFNNVADKYGSVISRYEGNADVYQSKIERSQYNTKASNLNNDNHFKVVKQEQNIYDQLSKQREEQQTALNTAIENGLTVGSEKWNEMQAEINATTLAMSQAQIAISQTYAAMFDQVDSKYEGVLQGFEHTEAMLNEYISQAEAKGHIVSTEYYNKLISNEKSNIGQLEKKQADLVAARDAAVDDGAIKKGSVEWYNMCSEIDSVTQEIEASETAVLEWNKAIRDIEWETFDLAQERIANLNDEVEFFIELMSNKKLYDDNGRLTNEGEATMGMHGQQYNTHMRMADNYGAEVTKLNEKIEQDPYDQDLINRRDELLKLQRDSILAAEQEKNAIRDLVEEGYNKELEALQDRIDKQNESLKSAKDLYDYQKKVKDQTKEIASLEKQMAAYSGDNSEEARQKIQQIKVQLEEAKENLQETEYDKYISDQERLLDNLFNEYETIINSRLDNIDGLVSEAITSINDNAGAIAQTLYSSAENVGYTMSEEMNTIWSEAKANADAENQRRIEQTQAIVDQLVANGTLTQEQANSIIAALGTGDAQSAQETLDLINQMVLNGQLAQEDANSIITALSLGNQQQVADTLAMLQELVADGKLSQQDAQNIINALVTGDAEDVANANNIITQLVANGTLAQSDADRIIEALNGAKAKDDKIVEEYDKDSKKDDTKVDKAVNKVEKEVKDAVKASNTKAKTEIKKNSTSTSAKKDPTKDHGTTKQKESNKATSSKATSTSNKATSSKATSTSNKAKTRSDKDYYGVALAIWNGNYGWGVGDTRKKHLKEKGFDADKMQKIVNKLGKDGYVPTGAWQGKYHGIKDLSPYHYKKFAQGAKNIGRDQLAWTQENGQEFIVRPSDGAILTPIAKSDSVLNATASGNIWDMANNPADFIKNNLKLDTSNVVNGTNVQSSIVQNFENITFSLPNVHGYNDLLKEMKTDPNFERLISSMTVDRIAGKSKLAKGKAIR